VAAPDATQFVFTFTNRDVDALNAESRHVRHDRGEPAESDLRLVTKHWPANFPLRDQVQFTDALKPPRICDADVGTITAIDPKHRGHSGTARLRP